MPPARRGLGPAIGRVGPGRVGPDLSPEEKRFYSSMSPARESIRRRRRHGAVAQSGMAQSGVAQGRRRASLSF